MMIKIDHRKGHQNNWVYEDILLWAMFILLRILYLLHIKRTVNVWLEFTDESIYSTLPGQESDQADWRKIFGSKTGANTNTNKEEIAVYRFLPKKKGDTINPRYLGDIEVALYLRDHEEFDAIRVQKAMLFKGGRVRFRVPIQLRYWIPVTPWAGGDKLNTSNYSFRMWPW